MNSTRPFLLRSVALGAVSPANPVAELTGAIQQLTNQQSKPAAGGSEITPPEPAPPDHPGATVSAAAELAQAAAELKSVAAELRALFALFKQAKTGDPDPARAGMAEARPVTDPRPAWGVQMAAAADRLSQQMPQWEVRVSMAHQQLEATILRVIENLFGWVSRLQAHLERLEREVSVHHRQVLNMRSD